MKHYVLFLTLISFHIHSTLLNATQSENAKLWETLKQKIVNKKNSTIVDKSNAMHKFYEKFYRVIYKNDLTLQQRNHAFAILCECHNFIEQKLDDGFFVDRGSAEDYVAKKGMDCIASWIQAKTEYECEQHAACNKKMQEKLGKEAHEDACSKFKQGISGSLSLLVDDPAFKKELHKKIEDLQRKKEIHEIYPHENGPRRQETLNNISNGKHYRDIACPICLEQYQETGERVNLPCGHDICPRCLNTNKYQYNRHECPKCRQHINNADFPADYLKKHM